MNRRRISGKVVIRLAMIGLVLLVQVARPQGNTDSTVLTFTLSPEGTSPRYVYAGTLRGVLRSSNYGDSWEHKNAGLPSPMLGMSIAIHPSSGKLFLGTYYGNGVYYSTNNGDNWIHCSNNGLTDMRIWSILIPADSSNHIMAATSGGGVFRSTDEGSSWVSTNQGMAYNFVYDLIQIPNGYIFAAAADANSNGSVYRSSDYGANWIQANLGLTDKVHKLACSNGYLYAFTDVQGVYRSTDSGNSWSQTAALPGLIGYALVAYGNTVIAGDFANPRVHKSINNGSSWVQLSQGLPGNTRVRTLGLADSAGLPKYVFLGAWGDGIFRSSDEGQTWVPKNNGLAVSVEVNEPQPATFMLDQNYPNPFNPATTIRFSIPVGTYGHTSLQVYDVLGREVAMLVNEVKPPGTYTVQFNAAGLASGVYLYRLTARGFTETKRLLLLR